MNRNKNRKVSDVFTDAELRRIPHYMAVALRHGRGAFRPVERLCCKEHEEWIPMLHKVEQFLGIAPARKGLGVKPRSSAASGSA